MKLISPVRMEPKEAKEPKAKPERSSRELQLDYPLGENAPGVGKKIQIAPGIYWLRMPLPLGADHVNLWLLRDHFQGRSGWTLVDTGVASEDVRGILKKIIASELEDLPVVRVLCTHYHADHLGNAAWLCEQFSSPLWMTLGEYTMGRVLQARFSATASMNNIDHFIAHGLKDEDRIEKLQRRSNHFAKQVPSIPRSFRRIVEGEMIMIGAVKWRVICGYGHSPEHACLYAEDKQLLISGDMLLPRITTNIGVTAMEPESNPLQQFLGSIDRLSLLTAENTLVMPSHGRPFKGLKKRVEQLHEHHEERLKLLRDLCVNSTAAIDVVPVMFKRALDSHQLYFAFGEAVAHLNYLWYAGEMTREAGKDGVYRFKYVTRDLRHAPVI